MWKLRPLPTTPQALRAEATRLGIPYRDPPIKGVDPSRAVGIAPESYTTDDELRARVLAARTDERNRLANWGQSIGIALAFVGSVISIWVTLHLHSEDQRPWVGFGPIDVVAPPTKGETIHARITIQNGGHSPALNLSPHWVFKPWLSPKNDTGIPLMNESDIRACTQPKPKWSANAGGGMILPGAQGMVIEPESPILNETVVGLITKKAGTYHYGPSGLAGDPELASVARATANTTDWVINLYLVGCIDYFDESHRAHRTSFTMIWGPSGQSPNGGLAAWTVGNSAD
jgi:hypothetical protein